MLISSFAVLCWCSKYPAFSLAGVQKRLSTLSCAFLRISRSEWSESKASSSLATPVFVAVLTFFCLPEAAFMTPASCFAFSKSLVDFAFGCLDGTLEHFHLFLWHFLYFFLSGDDVFFFIRSIWSPLESSRRAAATSSFTWSKSAVGILFSCYHAYLEGVPLSALWGGAR